MPAPERARQPGCRRPGASLDGCRRPGLEPLGAEGECVPRAMSTWPPSSLPVTRAHAEGTQKVPEKCLCREGRQRLGGRGRERLLPGHPMLFPPARPEQARPPGALPQTQWFPPRQVGPARSRPRGVWVPHGSCHRLQASDLLPEWKQGCSSTSATVCPASGTCQNMLEHQVSVPFGFLLTP